MRFRWIIIALSLLWSANMLLHPPEGKEGSWSNVKENIKENIKLGLDLKGGIYMQLQVDEDDAVRQYLEEQSGLIKGGMEADGFTVTSGYATIDALTVTMAGAVGKDGKDPVSFLEDRFSNSWAINKTGTDIVMELRDRAVREVKDEAVNQTVYKIQSRIDELGVTEPVINRTLGSNRIVVELAGADDSNRVHKIVREPGQLEWRLAVPGIAMAGSEAELIASMGRQLLPSERIMPFPSERQTSYMLMNEVILTAKNIADVYSTSDDSGRPAVGIKLDRQGGLVMTEKSGANIGQRLGIVLDGKVVSAPTIQSKLGDSFQITGLSQAEVPDLIVKIKSGSLPARVDILEERVIGPTLGRDAIASGSKSAIMGLVLVMIFIAVYYRGAGLIALVALTLNMILILGMLAGIGAVLTLPGIAGFILTIGMAVDANVLVFERIREELRAGIMPKNAVDVGYKTAFVTIMDANITTFLAAFILYLLGEGPVKGFAVMLMIGIICSIFTAVFCSRTFYLWVLKFNPSAKTLSIWPLWQSSHANKQ